MNQEINDKYLLGDGPYLHDNGVLFTKDVPIIGRPCLPGGSPNATGFLIIYELKYCGFSINNLTLEQAAPQQNGEVLEGSWRPLVTLPSISVPDPKKDSEVSDAVIGEFPEDFYKKRTEVFIRLRGALHLDGNAADRSVRLLSMLLRTV
jgi:hypothetical protein